MTKIMQPRAMPPSSMRDAGDAECSAEGTIEIPRIARPVASRVWEERARWPTRQDSSSAHASILLESVRHVWSERDEARLAELPPPNRDDLGAKVDVFVG